MSDTFVAGSKLRAIDMVPQKIWTVTGTSSPGSITTSETVQLTAPSTTYRAGRAYKLAFRAIFRSSSGTPNLTTIRIRDTNTSGTIRFEVSGRVLAINPATTNIGPFYFETYVANTGSSDITSRTLVLCMTADAANGVINAGANVPYYWNCIEMGAATDYTEAVAL